MVQAKVRKVENGHKYYLWRVCYVPAQTLGLCSIMSQQQLPPTSLIRKLAQRGCVAYPRSHSQWEEDTSWWDADAELQVSLRPRVSFFTLISAVLQGTASFSFVSCALVEAESIPSTLALRFSWVEREAMNLS